MFRSFLRWDLVWPTRVKSCGIRRKSTLGSSNYVSVSTFRWAWMRYMRQGHRHPNLAKKEFRACRCRGTKPRSKRCVSIIRKSKSRKELMRRCTGSSVQKSKNCSGRRKSWKSKLRHPISISLTKSRPTKNYKKQKTTIKTRMLKSTLLSSRWWLKSSSLLLKKSPLKRLEWKLCCSKSRKLSSHYWSTWFCLSYIRKMSLWLKKRTRNRWSRPESHY